MGDWQLKASQLKSYPHFDPVISAIVARALAQNPERVARHAFYPFLLYEQAWTKFAKKGVKGNRKTRKIRYAARADAYIFSYYRHLLSERYEAELTRLSLSDCVLAYRRIPTGTGVGGKCNIHHALDAFETVQATGDCFVLALDISSFFESLDHDRLKQLWCRLLGAERLPPDHFQVFRAITSYADVDKLAVYERLGHFGAKRTTSAGKVIPGYLTSKAAIPRRLCSGAEFRAKIAGNGEGKTLIRPNHKTYGIPQGAPISDLLANLYLLDFDVEMRERVEALGGRYMRYSDDILIVVQEDEAGAKGLEEIIYARIRAYGRKLAIKPSKTAVFEFRRTDNGQTCRHVFDPKTSLEGKKNGLEYLGFRYDGRRIYLRDSTISNLRRKVTMAARRRAAAHVRRYSDKDLSALLVSFDYNGFLQGFGRVEKFEEKADDYRNWTFWTYARRAIDILGSRGRPIARQLARHKALTYKRLDAEIRRLHCPSESGPRESLSFDDKAE